jgi:hypothetical protein
VLIKNNVFQKIGSVTDQKIPLVLIGDQTVMMDQMKEWNFVVIDNQDQIVTLKQYVHQLLRVLMINFNVLINLALVHQKSAMGHLIVLTDLMKDHSVM